MCIVVDSRITWEDLHGRLRSGRYVAPPVKRIWLEKADGGQRPRSERGRPPIAAHAEGGPGALLRSPV